MPTVEPPRPEDGGRPQNQALTIGCGVFMGAVAVALMLPLIILFWRWVLG